MDVLSIILLIVVIVIVLMFVVKIVKKVNVNLGKPTAVEVDPTSIGERMKKYLVKASKVNPKTARLAILSRTTWSEGGKIARIYGCIPTKDCTRFILQTHRFLSKKILMYCPTDLHSSLHNKEIMIYGVSVDSAGGYYYPIPDKNVMSNKQVFKIVSEAFETDLRRMLTMDSLQMELEQTYKGIAGIEKEKEFNEEPIEFVEPEKGEINE
jgi:hypothetical protein